MNRSRINYLKNELQNNNKTLAILQVTRKKNKQTKAQVKFLTKETNSCKEEILSINLEFLFDILSISIQKNEILINQELNSIYQNYAKGKILDQWIESTEGISFI